MDHFKIPVNKKFIYVGARVDWYGKTVLVEEFSVFWCTPALELRKEFGMKNCMKASASILVDGFLSTTCDLHEIIPINE